MIPRIDGLSGTGKKRCDSLRQPAARDNEPCGTIITVMSQKYIRDIGCRYCHRTEVKVHHKQQQKSDSEYYKPHDTAYFMIEK